MKKIITLIFLFFAFISHAQNVVKNVDAENFKKLMTDKKAVLIDLRTNDEIKNKGKIKGAQQLDFLDKEAETKIAKLDRKKTYLIYCAGGGRSGDCAELMQKLGFKSVINLEKGFEDWKRKGFEIEK
ncbi:MAG: rhodanese-like domain-containing protein [Bacteroidia bacterium]|nr:rhodanese-like domain-containing protein [Bacteroidia bacterium]